MHKKGTVPCVCVCGAGGGLGLLAFDKGAIWDFKVGRQAKRLGVEGRNLINSFKGYGSLLHHTIHLRAIIFKNNMVVLTWCTIQYRVRNLRTDSQGALYISTG